MDIGALKLRLQSHFSDGLVLIIGSGLSCAEGLPGMGALASILEAELPTKLRAEDRTDWEKVAALLPIRGLEAALLEVEVSDELQLLISQSVGSAVAESEAEVLSQVFSGARTLRLTRLVPHLLKSEVSLPLVTTNYDTLAEIAFEEAGL